MKKIVIGLLLILGVVSPTLAEAAFRDAALEALAVQHDGRTKPFLSFAKETLWFITGRTSLPNSSPIESLLGLLSSPEEAIRRKLIPISYQPLLQALGLGKTKQYFSIQDLNQNGKFIELYQAAEAKKSQGLQLAGLDNKLLEVSARAEVLQGVVSGVSICILPPLPGAAAPEGNWGSLAELPHYDAATQEEVLRLVKALEASVSKDQAAFDSAAHSLIQYLRTLGGDQYPSERKLALELFYEKSGLFQKSWIFYFLGFLLFLLPAAKNRVLIGLAWAGTLTGFVLHTGALALRIVIGGRAPVSNMYESLIFLAWSLVVVSICLSLIYRHRLILAVGSALGFLALLISDLLPINSNVSSLVPVLRSNYWLTIHVLTIVTSYGVFALAMGLGHFNLGLFIFAPRKKSLIHTTTKFLYRIIQIGVLLLAAGTILGGMWANESWGRFWGWDPKETWALISLLGYLAIVHGRFAGWLKDFGLALGSLIGFLLILMTYYGVNFILGQGLHSYGFASGGTAYVLGFVIFELIFISVACLRYRR